MVGLGMPLRGEPAVSQEMLKPGFVDDDKWFLKTPEPLSIPGMQYIKWKELFNKWKPVVPPGKWEQWKYFSEDIPTTKRAAISANTKASKKTRKGRERVVKQSLKVSEATSADEAEPKNSTN